jgi:hypothetical protein
MSSPLFFLHRRNAPLVWRMVARHSVVPPCMASVAAAASTDEVACCGAVGRPIHRLARLRLDLLLSLSFSLSRGSSSMNSLRVASEPSQCA